MERDREDASRDNAKPPREATALMVTGGTRRNARARMGVGVGAILAIAIMAPALSQQAVDEQQDPGREMAISAGCDMSQSDVPMVDGVIDYVRDASGGVVGGAPTLEQAVLNVRTYLAEAGAVYSPETLKDAAAEAGHSNPAEVRLPEALLSVHRWDDGSYAVTGLVLCA